MSLIDIYKDDVMWQKCVKYSLQKEKKKQFRWKIAWQEGNQKENTKIGNMPEKKIITIAIILFT